MLWQSNNAQKPLLLLLVPAINLLGGGLFVDWHLTTHNPDHHVEQVISPHMEVLLPTCWSAGRKLGLGWVQHPSPFLSMNHGGINPKSVQDVPIRSLRWHYEFAESPWELQNSNANLRCYRCLALPCLPSHSTQNGLSMVFQTRVEEYPLLQTVGKIVRGILQC